MAGFVKRVTLISADGEVSTLFRDKCRKSKRVSRMFRPAERVGFRLLKANDTFAETLLGRYRKSRGKRRNGWLRDSPNNMMKAGRKAMKKLTRI